MARILCVWSPNWAITAWRRRSASPPPGETVAEPAPFALVMSDAGTRRLAAVDGLAQSLGLYPGQKAADAAALAPNLATADHDPQADAQSLEALADWCMRFSPAVASDAPDGLFLDVSGGDLLWGGEEALAHELEARLSDNGIPARLAIADTAAAAWALARFDPIICPPGHQAAKLAPLPVAALRLDDADAAQLARLGLRTIGQVMGLPRGPLTRRFGPGVLLRLDQALGRLPQALKYRRPASPWAARLAFAEPISAPEDLARVAADLAGLLCAQLQAGGKAARRFELSYHRLDGKNLTVEAGLALAGRDPSALLRLLVPKLDTLDPGFGIESATILADDVLILDMIQTHLDPSQAQADAAVAPLVDRLANRLGADRVWRAQPVQSHAPERAVSRAQALSGSREAGWDPGRPRPLRLFVRPEPIEALAALPDAAPARFQWRGLWRRVARAEGPERIAQEWWRLAPEQTSTGAVRDYYRVEDESGGRFWLFRAGVYGGETAPRWWLHGVFG
jgi:protein ImuB